MTATRAILSVFASLPQAPMEALVDAFRPNHGQCRHVQRVAHSSPTTPDQLLVSFVATVPRAWCKPHSAVKALGSVDPMRTDKATSRAAVKEPIPPSGHPTIWEGCMRLGERVAAYETLRDLRRLAFV